MQNIDPNELFTFIEATMKLDSSATIVDIGSGTGLFAQPLLAKGYKVQI